MVEQQYRHRLHARFEALLDALPKGILDNDDEDEDDDGGGLDNAASGGGGGGGGAINGGRKGGGHGGKKPRRMSKVDVLNRAARVIRFLESDNERTRREVEMLRRERDAAFGRVAVRGG
ncbi:aaa77bca-86aa-42f5-8998-bf414e645327 [Thermothielavioides terrestris]|nr:aaa77bca-86aa-42f5-8998-bf414e645327 [Thermothielavioides terrestris]